MIKQQRILLRVERAYISIDVETTGPVPGSYSMISLGACLVDDLEKQFYREIKPFLPSYEIEAMKVASLGLNCLDKSLSEYNPMHEQFNPDMVLRVLEKEGQGYREAIKEFAKWTTAQTQGRTPVLLTDTQPFDAMFVNWYFDSFNQGRNPYGRKAFNIDVFYKGVCKNPNARLEDLGVVDERNPAHNALEDAIHQAKIAQAIFAKLS